MHCQPLRVLIACESSGHVREAFRALGHDAWSCDLLPAADDSPHHIQGDALVAAYSGQWGLMIAHPPCTYLSASGMHWTTRGLRDPQLTVDALEFAKALMDAPVPMICIENPVGRIGTAIRPADQYVQPYEFGHDASKRTGLWLKGLPRLEKDPNLFVAPRIVLCPATGKEKKRWANQTDSGQNRLTPSDDRWKERSVTYSGIAKAMASQWGAIVENINE